jgi:hypothetical protein
MHSVHQRNSQTPDAEYIQTVQADSTFVDPTPKRRQKPKLFTATGKSRVALKHIYKSADKQLLVVLPHDQDIY